MNNPVCWFEIYVEDMERARAFYEQTLDLQLAKLDVSDGDMKMWTFPMQQDGYGAPGALVQMPGFSGGTGGTLVYFSCTDCEATATKAKQAGGNIQKHKMAIGQFGFIALVIDTEGNLIGLHSMQ